MGPGVQIQWAAKPGIWDASLGKGTLTKQLEKGIKHSSSGSDSCQHFKKDYSKIPIYQLINQQESQAVKSQTRLPFGNPIWPLQKSSGVWKLTVDYRGLSEVMPPLSADVPDMLELLYELESNAVKWYATT